MFFPCYSLLHFLLCARNVPDALLVFRLSLSYITGWISGLQHRLRLLLVGMIKEGRLGFPSVIRSGCELFHLGLADEVELLLVDGRWIRAGVS